MPAFPLAGLEPEIVKIDMSLVRGVEREPLKRRIIGSMVTLCRDLGTLVVAEGVETDAERSVLVELGCHLLRVAIRSGGPSPAPRVVGGPATSIST